MQSQNEKKGWTTKHYVCRDRQLPGGAMLRYEPVAGPFDTPSEAQAARDRMPGSGPLYCARFRHREARRG